MIKKIEHQDIIDKCEKIFCDSEWREAEIYVEDKDYIEPKD